MSSLDDVFVTTPKTGKLLANELLGVSSVGEGLALCCKLGLEEPEGKTQFASLFKNSRNSFSRAEP